MNSSISCNIHYQFFKVSSLFNTSVFNSIFNVLNWSMNTVDGHISKWSILQFIVLSRHISTAFCNGKLNIKFGCVIHGANKQHWVHNIKTLCSITNSTGSKFCLIFNAQGNFFSHHFMINFLFETNLLQIQNNLSNVFSYSFKSSKFMLGTFNFYSYNGITLQRT